MNNLTTKYNFWLYKSKPNVQGKIPVYMRLTVGNKRTEVSTGIYINIKNWDETRQLIKDKEPDADLHNTKLDSLKEAFKKTVKQFIELDIDYTPNYLKSRILNGDKIVKSLLEYFKEHIDKMEKLKGTEFSSSTCQRYQTTYSHLKNFISEQRKVNDILLSHLNIKFLKDFIFYMKTEQGHNLNTAGKYAKNVKTVVKSAIADGYLKHDPFFGFVIKNKPVNMEYLNEAEIALIENKRFDISRIENIRKVFLFQCYTGLAYVDIAKLTKECIVDIKGKLWIVINRTKTNIPVRVPLIKKALDLIDYNIKGEKLFNVPTNQRFNIYLKELGAVCGINKNLCTHMARRTFATTITLLNGVSIDAVSKMLGHSKITTTQIYAKTVDDKLLKEMAKIE